MKTANLKEKLACLLLTYLLLGFNPSPRRELSDLVSPLIFPIYLTIILLVASQKKKVGG